MAIEPYNPLKGLQPGQTPPSGVNKPPVSTPVETSLRFNPDFSGLYRNLDRQQVDIANQKNQQISGLTSQYRRAQDQASRMQKLAQERLKARMSDQGILRSGINVGAQGNQQEDYLRMLDDLSNQHTQGVQSVENQTAQALSQLGFQREQLMQEQARAEQEARMREALAKARVESQQPKVSATGQLVRQAFAQHGLNPATQQETAEQRLNRIGTELDAGRTPENLMQSLKRAQQQVIQSGNMPEIQNMVQNLFGTYGQRIDTQQETQAQRLQRIAGELVNGRSLDSLLRSLQLMAG